MPLMMSNLPVNENVLGITLVLGALLLGLAVVVFIIAAFFSVLFARMDLGMKVVWIILIFLAPFIGALLWFVIGRPRAG